MNTVKAVCPRYKKKPYFYVFILVRNISCVILPHCMIALVTNITKIGLPLVGYGLSKLFRHAIYNVILYLK